MYNEHALDRAYERYAVCLSNDDLHEMELKIQAGDAVYKGIDWPASSKWLVAYKGISFLVAYRGRERRIATFLTLNEI